MEILPLTYHEFKTFFLIFIRVSVFMFMFPFFSARVIPVFSKAGFSLIVSIILFPVIETGTGCFPDTALGMGRLVISEIIAGMILGLLVEMFFEAVRIMGNFVGFQTGFALANVLDPQSGTEISIISNMAYFVAVVLFLLLNGHHIVLGAMKDSFELIKVGTLSLNRQLFQEILGLSADMFVIAVKIASPAMAALLFTKVAFGVIVKFMPQMNIMIVAFPVQIVIGLVFFGISLNVLLILMEGYIGRLDSLLINTMSLLRG